MSELEHAFLVGIWRPGQVRWQAEDSFHELKELTRTAGAQVVGEAFQHLKSIHPRFFIGTGKVQEMKDQVFTCGADLVILDEELTPAQQNHLAEVLEVKVLDRTGLILDIFSQRAKSKEGKLQVELAALEYLYPRLKGQGHLMSRLGAGIGTRGPGETKLETDRRRMRDRISKLKDEIQSIQQSRELHRRKRKAIPMPVVTLVGYTNTGKSTLLNALTHAQVFAENKLFATLDPTTRRLRLPSGHDILLTDTVGFIKKLPVELIDAFRATLEELEESDVLVHVMDASDPYLSERVKEVMNVLTQLGVDQKPMLYVYNKEDCVKDLRHVFIRQGRLQPSCTISALNHSGLDTLLKELEKMTDHFYEWIDLSIPITDQKTLALIHACGVVAEVKYSEKTIQLKAHVTHPMAEKLRQLANKIT
ncbi:MAG: GTPase HflX [Deltaproteobacteria bacterium]|nr:GTPase HflX [Deltaproteobacteria bacterium]